MSISSLSCWKGSVNGALISNSMSQSMPYERHWWRVSLSTLFLLTNSLNLTGFSSTSFDPSDADSVDFVDGPLEGCSAAAAAAAAVESFPSSSTSSVVVDGEWRCGVELDLDASGSWFERLIVVFSTLGVDTDAISFSPSLSMSANVDSTSSAVKVKTLLSGAEVSISRPTDVPTFKVIGLFWRFSMMLQNLPFSDILLVDGI